MDEELRELSLEDMSYVGGGEGFWSDLAATVTGWLSGGRETSIPAQNADLGIRG